jgi:hypothetical protein
VRTTVSDLLTETWVPSAREARAGLPVFTLSAVGLTGDDYHDKLIALRALRPSFPGGWVGGTLGTLSAGIYAFPALGVLKGRGFAEGITRIGQQFSVQLFGGQRYGALHRAGIIYRPQAHREDRRLRVEAEVGDLDIALCEERGYDL